MVVFHLVAEVEVSRIGKKLIDIPDGVNISVNKTMVTVKGPKGELNYDFPWVQCKIEDQKISVIPDTNVPRYKAFWGLSRSLLQGMVTGVNVGFTKELKIVGTGYRAAKQGKNLSINVGYSSPVVVEPLEGITLELPDVTTIVVKGINKQLVGQMAANIRKIRPPEPYKGKGIRYSTEKVRRKEGKSK